MALPRINPCPASVTTESRPWAGMIYARLFAAQPNRVWQTCPMQFCLTRNPRRVTRDRIRAGKCSLRCAAPRSIPLFSSVLRSQACRHAAPDALPRFATWPGNAQCKMLHSVSRRFGVLPSFVPTALSRRVAPAVGKCSMASNAEPSKARPGAVMQSAVPEVRYQVIAA